MNQIIDRFYRILRSYGVKTDEYEDLDYSAAWDELNDFLSGKDETSYNSSNSLPPDFLREDYRVMEVAFGVPFKVVKKQYLFLVKKYHPDRNNTSDEKIKAVNISYNRIRAWERAKQKAN